MKRINEIFYSVQGEGFWAGTPMIFVRFAGCNLKCDFCDTKHDPYTEMSDEDILNEINKYPSARVCITGGEPTLQLNQEFVDLLHLNEKKIHVETNGTRKTCKGIDWVTISPKNDKIALVRADEMKLVYQGQDVEEWLGYPATHFYLQPLSCTNTNKVIDYIKQNPKWKISIQTQKLLNFQ